MGKRRGAGLYHGDLVGCWRAGHWWYDGTTRGRRTYTGRMGHPYDGVDLRKHPEAYRIGRGEQGVFHAEPYKSELLPLWRFKDTEAAKESVDAIYGRFLDYKDEGDFVGMDVARKYLQMGWTRSLRYSRYKGGKKSNALAKPDPEKSKCATIFKTHYDHVRNNAEYIEMKKKHKESEHEKERS